LAHVPFLGHHVRPGSSWWGVSEGGGASASVTQRSDDFSVPAGWVLLSYSSYLFMGSLARSRSAAITAWEHTPLAHEAGSSWPTWVPLWLPLGPCPRLLACPLQRSAAGPLTNTGLLPSPSQPLDPLASHAEALTVPLRGHAHASRLRHRAFSLSGTSVHSAQLIPAYPLRRPPKCRLPSKASWSASLVLPDLVQGPAMVTPGLGACPVPALTTPPYCPRSLSVLSTCSLPSPNSRCSAHAC